MKEKLKKLRKFLHETFPLDKLLHAYLGDLTLIPFILLVLVIPANLSIYSAIIIGSVLNGLIVGFLKEELDAVSKEGTVDKIDWLATIIGSVFSGLRLILLFYIISTMGIIL